MSISESQLLTHILAVVVVSLCFLFCFHCSLSVGSFVRCSVWYLGLAEISRKTSCISGQQCAPVVIKANCILGCSNRGITSRSSEVVIPHYLALSFICNAMPGFWSISTRKKLKTPCEASSRMEERLRELDRFCLEKMVRGGLLAAPST